MAVPQTKPITFDKLPLHSGNMFMFYGCGLCRRIVNTKMSGKNEKNSRKRAKNYTNEEEVLLVELVDAYKNVLENKKSDAVIWRRKEEVWRKIEEEFSATSGTYRHWKTLRDKYEVINRKSKTEIATQKLETYRTWCK